MKKLLSLLFAALMIAALLLPAAAVDTRVYKTYAEAAEGDLLWMVDFTAAEVFDPQPDENAARNFVYTIGDDGRSVTLNAVAGATNSQPNYWGGPIKGLEVDRNSLVTMTFKIRANGNKGSNNSTGVGGWLFDNPDGGYNTRVCHNYSNWNTVNADGSSAENRAILCIGSTKKANNGGYLYAIKQAVSDEEGFMTCRMEFSGPDAAIWLSYLGADGNWVLDEGNTWALEQLNDTPDSLSFVFYAYTTTADATVKDVKYFRGIGLTNEQLSADADSVAAASAAAETTAIPPPSTDTAAETAPTVSAAEAMPDLTAVCALLTLLLAAAAAVLIKETPV